MSTAGEPRRVEIVTPDLGVAKMTLSLWFAEPGDRVHAGDRLVEIVAEGFSFDVPAPATGRLAERLRFARDAVKPGTPLGYVLTDPEE